MNMNVFFADSAVQLQGIKGSQMNSGNGPLFAKLLLNSMTMDQKGSSSEGLLSSDFAEMFQALSSQVDLQLFGLDTSSMEAILENDVLFSKILLEGMYDESVIKADSESKELMTELKEVLSFVSKLSSDEASDLQKLIQQMLETISEGISNNVAVELETYLVNSRFDSLESVLKQLASLLASAQKGEHPKAQQFQLKNQFSNQLHSVQSNSVITNNVEVLDALQNKDLIIKNILQALTSEVEKTKELVSILKKLIATSELKDFHGITSNNQSGAKTAHIPLHVLQHLTSLKKADDNANMVKEEKVESNVSKIVASSLENSANQNKGYYNAEETSVTRQTATSVNNNPSEVQFRDQMMMTSSQNSIQEPMKTATTNEVKLTYTNANDMQKQIEELVVNQAKLVKKPNGQQSMIVTLNPAHLGSIKITVTANQGIISTNITTDTSMTKELIESTMSTLRAALSNTGIHLDRIEVIQQNNQSQSTTQSVNAQSQLQQQKKEHDQQNEQKKNNSKGSSKFSIEELEELALDFINENQIDKRFGNEGYSAAVNYTA